jgi:deoxyribonuclease IV
MTARSPLSPRILLGSNVSGVGGIDKGFLQANAWECLAMQIYSTPSRRWEVPPLHPDLREAFLESLQSSAVHAVIAHVPFLVNLATPDAAALDRSLVRLETEIRRAEELALTAVVLHPGAGGASERQAAIAQVARALRHVIEATADCSTEILIENMAGQGTTLCANFAELAELLEIADAGPRLGMCFDTAHAFIAGYPLSGYDGYEQVIRELDACVGLNRVRAVHLNDALSGHGSRHDRHAAPGEGQMGTAVFHAFMRDERFVGRPAILEVPDRDGGTLRALRRLRDLAQRNSRVIAGNGFLRDAEMQLALVAAQ